MTDGCRSMLAKVLACPGLPTLPTVAVRVLELTADPDVNLRELAKAIASDQGLAARLLRTVNSSYYGLRRKCTTVDQAVMMLGLRTVRSLSLGFSLVATLREAEPEQFDHLSYWRRALYSATAARRLARQCGLDCPEEAMLAGLLQDMGMIALHQALGERYERVLRAAGPDHRQLARHELEALELQHPDVGAQLAQRWRLPDELVVPIRYHEKPTAAPASHAELVRVVALAIHVHDILTLPEPFEDIRTTYQLARQWFRIDSTPMERLIHEIAESVREMSNLFRLDTGPYPDAEAIMKAANARLVDSFRDGAPAAPDQRLQRLLIDGEETDPITGAMTRAALDRRLPELHAAARSHGRPLALVIVRLDQFDALAARIALAELDPLVVETASAIAGSLPQDDALLARYGADTFVLAVPGLQLGQASRLALAIHAAVSRALERQSASMPAIDAPVTASVGVTADTGCGQDDEQSCDELLAAAIRAADAARVAGGDCVRSMPMSQAA